MLVRGDRVAWLSRLGVTRAAVAIAAGAAGVAACVLDDVTAPGIDAGAIALAVRGDSIVALGDSTRLTVELSAAANAGPSRVHWTSSDTTVATVDSAGVVRGRRAGPVTVTASLAAPELLRDVETTWPMMVVYGAISVDPPDPLTGLGETRALVAHGTDVHGVPQEPVPATFTAVDTGIVTLTDDGVVTARGNGLARVVASYAGLSDTTVVRVQRVAKSVTFGVPALALPALQRDTVVPVRVRDTRDSLMTAMDVAWRSSDPSAISVSEGGTIRALRAAPSIITASVDTVVAQLEVRVAQVVGDLGVAAGDGQAHTVGAPVPVPPAVRVRDGNGYPIAGVSVTFTVSAGGGGLSGGSQVTDTAGTARVGAWIVGTVAGDNRLDATAAGLSATITATGVAGPPAGSTSQVGVSTSTVTAGGTVTLTLRARDQYGNAITVGGRTVVFTASGGSSAGQISATSDDGDGSYSATFSATTAGTATTIGASIDGAPVTSTLPTVTVVAGTPARIAVVTGNGQQANAGSAVSVAPVVAVYDALDNPLAGVTVTFAVTAGGGSVTGTTPTTDGTGRASVTGWTLGTTAGENHLTATAQSLSVTLTATGTPGPASVATSVITASDDTVASGAAVSLTLQTRDQYGNLLTTGGRTVAFSASGGTATGTISPTVDDGDGRYVATFSGVTAGSATAINATINGAAVTPTAPTVTVTPGPPASLVVLAGDGQSVQVAQAVPVAPSVRVLDAHGNVVPGATVVFAAADGSGSVAGGFQTSDMNGQATVLSWTLGTRAGTQGLTGTAGGAAVQFVATGTPGPLSLSGTRVTVSDDTVASGSTITLALQTADEYGNPIALTGRSVRFTSSGGGSGGAISPTKPQGGGLYTAVFTGEEAGTATTISATVDNAGVTSPSPTVTVIAGPPTSISRWAGQNQTGPVATALPIAPAVFVKDARNNPVPGVTVTFSITAGDGQVNDSVQVTDANGIATVGAWVLGTVAGATNTLLAMGGGFSVSFSASAVPGPASAATSTIAVEKDSVEVGHDTGVTLYATDAYGNALSSGGDTVAFYYEGGTSVGTFGTTADKADGRYEVRFVGVTAGTWGQIRAMIDGVLVATTPPPMRVWE